MRISTFYLFLCFFVFNLTVYGSGRKKQESCRSFRKEWREKVKLLNLVNETCKNLIVISLLPLCLSYADRLMSLKQKCCRVKNYRFTFAIIMKFHNYAQ